MANFAMHTGSAATLGSGLATFVVLQTELDVLAGAGLLFCFVTGTLLPDIDVDNGRPVRWLFQLFAALAALVTFLIVHPLPKEHPEIHAFAAAALAWILIRYPVARKFQRLTRHRGLAHSLIAGLLWSLAWVYIAINFLALDELLAWLQGVAIFLGFILHLLLDEIYSVDLEGMRIKRSFGTAFKLYQKDFISGSLLAFAGVLLLTWQLPWPEVLIEWMQPWFS